jgi:3-oxoacyl-[acyl-carrier protein] reductase
MDKVNEINLKGQVAVVTGGAQGIGLAVAERLTASGARVAIWDRDLSRADAAARKLGGVAHGVDVTDAAGLARAAREVERALGPVQILVTSAGIAGVNGRVMDYDPAEWDRILAVNLTGTFLTCRAVLPQMVAANYGRIVTVASIAGKEGNPDAGAYSASKAGVIALTKSLGKEHAGQNIAVNCITPAVAKTGIIEGLKPEFITYMLSKVPRGRFLETAEVAAMVAWLVSPENSFTTGAVFDLSGGRATY